MNAAEISLTPRQQYLLEQLSRRQTAPHRLITRAQIILTLAFCVTNEQAASQLQLNRHTIRKWRHRWLINMPRLIAAEEAGETEKTLEQMIHQFLTDAPRPGVPATFTPEQMTQIVALACEAPQASDRPVSHWTPKELAAEAAKRGIVEQISPRHVGRFLKSGRLKTAFEPLLAQRQSLGWGSI